MQFASTSVGLLNRQFYKRLNLKSEWIKYQTMSETSTKYNDQFHESGEYGKDDRISLRIGAPGRKMLAKCASTMEKATSYRLAQEKENGYLFQYGATLGDWNFRKNLAQFLSEHYKENVNLGSLMVTGGASQGLYLTASLFFEKDCPVFVEDPTYFIALNLLKEDLHMNILPVSMDAEGMSIQLLETQLKSLPLPKDSGENIHLYRAMVYIIPAFHNPTGICYSTRRCKELVEIAAKHNLLILCDDVYNLLHYDSEDPPKPLVFFDKIDGGKGHVISNGSFSKIFGPGMRLGWIQTSEDILKHFQNSGIITSGGNVNNYTSGIIASAIENGYQTDHLLCARELYQKNMNTVSKILKENLPSGCYFENPHGGYFLWITLPSHIVAEDLNKWLLQHHKLLVHPGSRCSALGNFHNCIRIAVTYHDEDILFDAVNRLCKAIANYSDKNQ